MELFGYNILDVGAVTLLILLVGAVLKWLLTELKTRGDKIEAIQDARLKDAAESIRVFDDVIEIMNRVYLMQEDLSEDVKEKFNKVIEEMQNKAQRLEDIIRNADNSK